MLIKRRDNGLWAVPGGWVEGETLSEAAEIGFFHENNLPQLSPGHDLRVPVLFKILRGEVPAPYFDKPAAVGS